MHIETLAATAVVIVAMYLTLEAVLFHPKQLKKKTK